MGQRSAIVLCALLLCAGCARRAPATATPAMAEPATTQVAAPPAVTPMQPPVSTQPTIFTSPRHGYTVTLPCCWVGMPVPALTVEAVLAELRQTPEAEATDLTDQLPEGELDNALELVAVLPDAAAGAPKAQLTVSVLPGRWLTLDQYLEATSAELTAIANTEVRATRLDDSLRADQMPVAVIEYATHATRPVAGLQIAFYLEGVDNLIVLTFTTAEELYTELAGDFADIARQVTLGAPRDQPPG